jgi:protein SCO1/2
MKPQMAKIPFLPAIVILSLIAGGCARGTHVWHGSPYPDTSPAPDFELTDTQGEPFRLSAQRGKALLLFFGYTSCPDICPATVGEMRSVFDQMGPEASKAIFAFITVDPERDSPQVLRDYLDKFNPNFVGLWGDAESLAATEGAYGVFAQAEDHQPGEPYEVTHTARVFFIDPEGLLRTNYALDTDPEDILADLQYVTKGMP